MSTMIFEITDKLVRVIESTPPEPGARLIVIDDDGARFCEVESVSTGVVAEFTTPEGGWRLELRSLPWPDGWSIHKNGDGHELHRPINTKEDDQ